MKKNLIILFLFLFAFACKSDKIKSYEQDDIEEFDTLNIRKIKIKTH